MLEAEAKNLLSVQDPAPCPVCERETLRPFSIFEGKAYHRCDHCMATILDPRHRLDRQAEHAHYLTHQNRIDDPGYQRFLGKLAEPLLTILDPGSSGLDYGCGPGPALAHMLRDGGHRVELFDPFFAPDPEPLGKTYDFVTCTEVAEHFFAPAREFRRLATLVRPGGWLGVMTMFQTDDARFADWHYRKDPTHVVFYRARTFRVVAANLGWRCDIPQKDVALLQRPLDAASSF